YAGNYDFLEPKDQVKTSLLCRSARRGTRKFHVVCYCDGGLTPLPMMRDRRLYYPEGSMILLDDVGYIGVNWEPDTGGDEEKPTLGMVEVYVIHGMRAVIIGTDSEAQERSGGGLRVALPGEGFRTLEELDCPVPRASNERVFCTRLPEVQSGGYSDF